MLLGICEILSDICGASQWLTAVCPLLTGNCSFQVIQFQDEWKQRVHSRRCWWRIVLLVHGQLSSWWVDTPIFHPPFTHLIYGGPSSSLVYTPVFSLYGLVESCRMFICSHFFTAFCEDRQWNMSSFRKSLVCVLLTNYGISFEHGAVSSRQRDELSCS